MVNFKGEEVEFSSHDLTMTNGEKSLLVQEGLISPVKIRGRALREKIRLNHAIDIHQYQSKLGTSTSI